jgi:hypothetical protein
VVTFKIEVIDEESGKYMLLDLDWDCSMGKAREILGESVSPEMVNAVLDRLSVVAVDAEEA